MAASSTRKSQSSVPRLAVAVIGEGERLGAVISRVCQSGELELRAQAGMKQHEAGSSATWFGDTRVLIANAPVQAVLLASTTRGDGELAELAAQRGLHVWRLPPIGTRFADAAETRTRAARHGSILRVASWWEYAARNVWEEFPWPAGFRPDFSEVRVSAAGPASGSWRAAYAESAGGALVDAGYGMLEALVAVRGLPESVSAATAHRPGARPGAARETEDIAIAVLRYPGGGRAIIRSAWDIAPLEQLTLHHSDTATVALTDQQISLVNADGTTAHVRPLPGDFLTDELQRFVELVRLDARDRVAATLDRHLAVAALAEAIYLSARTNQPESPHKFYELQGLPEPRS
jgi:predicted dehydrogenase